MSGGQEEGSLLGEALAFMKYQRETLKNVGPLSPLLSQGQNDGLNTSNDSETVFFSMYILDACETNLKHTEIMSRIARLGNITNTILSDLQKRIKYPWFVGGEGISFGVDVKYEKGKSTPYLKACCRYGSSVTDEWYSISVCFFLSKVLWKIFGFKVAIEALDVGDGQVLLIESALELPEWVDKLGPMGCENRVWVIDGKLHLIPPSLHLQTTYHEKNHNQLTIFDAIKILNQSESLLETKGNENIQKSLLPRIQSFLHLCEKDDELQSNSVEKYDDCYSMPLLQTTFRRNLHRAAVIVPFKLAILIQERQDLISSAILSFCSHGPDYIEKISKKTKESSNSENSSINLSKEFPFRNLVFLVIPFTKTAYTMLMSGAGRIPQFDLPKEFRSIETTRMSRKCRADTSSHFKNAIETGARLTCAFEWLYSHSKVLQLKTKNMSNNLYNGAGDVQKRVCVHWKQIDKLCGGDGIWIDECWRDGPNNETQGNASITELVKCAVFDPEIKRNVSLCLHSMPNVPIHEQINKSIKKGNSNPAINNALLYPFPRISDVDSDEWINLSAEQLDKIMNDIVSSRHMNSSNADHHDEKKVPKAKLNETKALDSILSGFKTFIKSSSDFEGVDIDKKNKTNVHPVHSSSKLNFKSSLQDEELNDYFSDEDDEYSSSGEDDDLAEIKGDREGGDTNVKMKDFMHAMDEELKSTSVTHSSQERNGSEPNEDRNPNELKIDEEALSNLLQSMGMEIDSDMGGSMSGPASNMLREMGIQVPSSLLFENEQQDG